MGATGSSQSSSSSSGGGGSYPGANATTQQRQSQPAPRPSQPSLPPTQQPQRQANSLQGIGTRQNRTPGAFSVSGPAQYQVTIPPGVRPGQTFQVSINQQRVLVRCPETMRPGQELRITLPRNGSGAGGGSGCGRERNGGEPEFSGAAGIHSHDSSGGEGWPAGEF